jgi:AcrR family transcriptional regulator
LSAAVELIGRDPGRLSSREVARHADVSPGVVHHYFGDHDALIDACIETMYEEVDHLGATLRSELAAGHRRPAEVLERAVREGYRLGRRHHALVRVLLARVAVTGALDAHRRDATEGPSLAVAASLLAKALSLPEVEIRMRLKTMSLSIARWAVSSDEELERLIDTPPDRARAIVEEHLVGVAKQLFPL